MRRSNFPLRLASSLLEEARKVADGEGVALNQLINIAVAEKVSALRTEDFFRERARQSDVQGALHILDRAGSQLPQPGDELSEGNSPATTKKELDRALRKAIQTKHLLKFNYKGQERIAEPHDYGIQKGVVRLFCYQVAGESSNRLPGWRWIDVSEMRDCQVVDRGFAGGREIPSGQHHQWDEVFIRVEPARSRRKQVPRC